MSVCPECKVKVPLHAASLASHRPSAGVSWPPRNPAAPGGPSDIFFVGPWIGTHRFARDFLVGATTAHSVRIGPISMAVELVWQCPKAPWALIGHLSHLAADGDPHRRVDDREAKPVPPLARARRAGQSAPSIARAAIRHLIHNDSLLPARYRRIRLPPPSISDALDLH
jgi:hypothetical protein